MKKKYKINIWRAGYILGMLISPLFLIGISYALYAMIRDEAPMIFIYLGVGMLFAASVIFGIFYFYYNKLVISVDNNALTYKMPDRRIIIGFQDIYAIQRALGPAGVYYYVFYEDKNGKRKKIEFTQDLEDSEQLVQYLEKKSKVKMRQEGTLEVKETDKPVIKVLKIVFNVIITLIIVWLLVIWPFMHAWSN